jgi:hypothetical protein
MPRAKLIWGAAAPARLWPGVCLCLLHVCASFAASGLAASSVSAQEDYKPFTERLLNSKRTQPEARPPPLPPMGGAYNAGREGPGGPGAQGGPAAADSPVWPGDRANADPGLRPGSSPPGAPLVPRDAPVEKSDLPPIEGAAVAAPLGRAPSEMWRGLDPASFEQIIPSIELPPRSPAIHSLWTRLATSEPGVSALDEAGRRFLGIRAEALHRTGLLAEEVKLLEGAGLDDPLVSALLARIKVGLGDADAGCELARGSVRYKSALPGPLRTEIMLLTAYCAAAAKNTAAVELAAELLREEGAEASFGLTVLEAFAANAKPKFALPRQVSLTDYRLLELTAGFEAAPLIERAAPALLSVLATTSGGDPRLRVLAAEAAARLNVIGNDQLADAWRAAQFQPQELADPASAKVEPALRRALLFRAAETERTPFKKTRVIRALLDDSRRAGLFLDALALMARQVDAIQPAEEISWFAETAIETQLAAGNFESARRWVQFASRGTGPTGGGALQHWLALADIADPRMAGPRGQSLGSVEALALRGRYSADLLHRLATVLDALDYNVPIPLWDAASRSPQPATGHLPATGVLSQLQDAAKKGETGRTVMLTMATLGPNGGEGAHMIALGDSIRALRRAKLDAEARRLGIEALFAGWPRSGGS